MLLLALSSSLLVKADKHYLYLGEDRGRYLGQYISRLEDREGLLSIDDAKNALFLPPAGADIPNLGISRSVHWLRLNIANASDVEDLVLHLGHPEIDEVDAWLVDKGRAVRLGRRGLDRPPDPEWSPYGDLTFPLPIPPGSARAVILRLRSVKPVQLPLQVWTREAYLSSNSARNTYIGGYAGIMLVMAIYNLFVFVSMRDRSYLVYVLYILSVLLAQLSFIGITPVVLAPTHTWLASKASILLTTLTAVAAGEFLRHFLHTHERLPSFSRATHWFYGAFALGIALDLMGHRMGGYKVIQAVSALFACYLLAQAYFVSRQGYRPGIYFLAAWSVFLAGVMMFVLKDWGILPYSALTKYTMPVGSVVEVVLLSFGLADRINVLRQDKERSQADALRVSQENEKIIREQNIVLEQKVHERTRALQESNDHLKRTQSQLVDAEKMASLGQLTAGIAHEINNPVNFITSNIDPLRRDLDDLLAVLAAYRSLGADVPADLMAPALRLERELDIDISIEELGEIIGSIAEGADRTAEIVRGLRNFSRLDEDDLKAADLNEGIRSTITVLGPQLRDQVQLDLELNDLPKVECFAGKLNQVFMNILTNAAQALTGRPDGRITVRTLIVDAHTVEVRIRDNGPGMPEHVRSRIFEPFYTTKEVGEGTGLGLSIAYNIIDKHHGRISVESAVGMGTEFRITLPVDRPRINEERA
ncbi:MAG: hypothetical protein KDC03_15575 [Flavobacteriales bacterium]|nr:hypothetical protein [Flavobacteriales bacterium]